MTRLRIGIGVAIGFVAAIIVLALVGDARPAPQPGPGPTLSDCDGAIREMVIHYLPDGAAATGPVYRQFLGDLPADVTVYVVCPDVAAFDDLVGRVGEVACTLEAIPVAHPMTSWSRDRWLALAGTDGGPVTLLRPRGEDWAEAWPARAGDERIADDIASFLAGRVRARRSSLLFDGGDFAADRRTVFVTPDVAKRNIQHTVTSREELLDELRRSLGRPVVLLDEAPPHHAGMFMMPVGEGRVFVGDPSLAADALNDVLPPDVLPGGPDFSDETQGLFDAVARRCQAEGYEVTRIPVVPGVDGRTYLTYLNVIIDHRDGRRIVYMPTYQYVDALNARAAETWRAAGYEVRPIDCTEVYRHFGSLRCLVSILAR